MATNFSGNKEKLTIAIINIIKKLKISTGLKREKYMDMVRNEFKLGKQEKWVITKLRMMLLRLDACLELLQIRKSENTKTKKSQSVAKETNCHNSLTNSQRAKNLKGTKLAVLKTEQSKSAVKQAPKVGTLKQIKTTKKARKGLEYRQLEKLRNMKFDDHEEYLNNSENKVAFLKALNLEPRVIFL